MVQECYVLVSITDIIGKKSVELMPLIIPFSTTHRTVEGKMVRIERNVPLYSLNWDERSCERLIKILSQ